MSCRSGICGTCTTSILGGAVDHLEEPVAPREAGDVMLCCSMPGPGAEVAIGFDEASPMAGLGLGWVFVAAQGVQPALLEKSGGGAGFMSDIVFAPGRDVGEFVAVNRVDFPMFFGLTDGLHKLIASLVTR